MHIPASNTLQVVLIKKDTISFSKIWVISIQAILLAALETSLKLEAHDVDMPLCSFQALYALMVIRVIAGLVRNIRRKAHSEGILRG